MISRTRLRHRRSRPPAGFFARALLILVGAALVSSCAMPAKRSALQRYVPTSRNAQPLGELGLGNTEMRLSELQGVMKLQFVGIMPGSAGDELAGASVYRVKNGARYFKENAGREGYCAEAPLWVSVNSDNGAPAWSQEIRVALLTLEQWKTYSPATNQPCLSGEYVRTPAG